MVTGPQSRDLNNNFARLAFPCVLAREITDKSPCAVCGITRIPRHKAKTAAATVASPLMQLAFPCYQDDPKPMPITRLVIAVPSAITIGKFTNGFTKNPLLCPPILTPIAGAIINPVTLFLT